MIKRIGLALGCLFLACGLFFLPVAHAQETVTVDLSVNNGTAAQNASGFLSGISASAPSNSFVNPMAAKFYRMDDNSWGGGCGGLCMDSALYSRIIAQGAIPEVIIGDLFIDNVGGYNPSNLRVVDSSSMANFLAMVTAVVNATNGAGQTVQWDIWNEPDNTAFWTGTEMQYQTMWQNAVNTIRGTVSSVGSPQVVLAPGSRPAGMLDGPDGVQGIQTVGSNYMMFYASGYIPTGGTSGAQGLTVPVSSGLDNLPSAYSIYTPTTNIGLGASGAFDQNYVGGGGFYNDTADGILIMMYHGENWNSSAFVSGLGLAVSHDNGVTWTKLGAVIEIGASRATCIAKTGDGDPGFFDIGGAVLEPRSDGYTYSYFIDTDSTCYTTPYTQGGPMHLAVARASTAALIAAALAGGQPSGTLFQKYQSGSYSQPGVLDTSNIPLGGGTSTNIAPTPTDGGYVYWPAIAYDSAISEYVLTYSELYPYPGNNTDGIGLAFSPDGIAWSNPTNIFNNGTTGSNYYTYPTPFNTSGGDANTLGSSFYIYYDQNFGTWSATNYDRVQINLTAGQIVGPSTCGCNQGTYSGWSTWATDLLAFAKTNNVLPNIVSFHENDTVAQMTADIASAKIYLAANDPSITKIEVNEFSSSTNTYYPGTLAQYLASAQRSNLWAFAHSCWTTGVDPAPGSCFNNSLDGLIGAAPSSSNTRAVWYVQQAYGAIVGTIAGVTPSTTVDGIAGQNCVATQTANSLLGRAGATSLVTVDFTHLSTFCSGLIVGGQVAAKVYAVVNDNGTGSSGPTLVSSGNLTVSGNAVAVSYAMGTNDALIIQLSAPVSSGPTATLSPTSLNFSATVGATSAEQSSTLTNSGSSTLNIASINIGGTNPTYFTPSGNCGATLSPTQSCLISLDFSPTAATSYAATVTVTSNASPTTSVLTLSGTGVAPGAGIYIAQTGAGSQNGTSCSNAYPVTFFNTSGNWGTSAGQIGLGTTVHVCGTITTALGFQGSGTMTNPITLLAESGAILTQPAGDLILLNGNANIVLDGGTNGILQNTANGTNLANQVSVQAVEASGASNIEMKNWVCQNIFVAVAPNTLPIPGGVNPGCIYANGISGLISIHDNTFNDAAWLVQLGGLGSGSVVYVYNMKMFHMDHGIVVGGCCNSFTVFEHDNHFYDEFNWDTGMADYYHHDPIHLYNGSSGPGNWGTSPGVYYWLYNNLFDGNRGYNYTSDIYYENGNPTQGEPHVYDFNNVDIQTPGVPMTNGFRSVGDGSAYGPMSSYNNTFLCDPTVSGQFGVRLTSISLLFQNNVITGCNNAISIEAGSSGGSGIDYNLYANQGAGGNYLWNWEAIGGTNTFSTWQSNCGGCDAHSSYQNSAGLSSTGVIQSGSPVLGAGKNLTSLGITALDSDTSAGNSRTPVARPASGAWAIGAYTGSSSVPTVTLTPPSPFNFGSVQTGSTSSYTETLLNNGGATLTGTITITGTGYSIIGGTCDDGSLSLAAGLSCTVNVQFAPMTVGTSSGTLTFTTNASTSPDTVALTGTGIAPLGAPTDLQIFILQ